MPALMVDFVALKFRVVLHCNYHYTFDCILIKALYYIQVEFGRKIQQH